MEVDWASGTQDSFYPDTGYPAQVPFNYNQLEGRFKQLQGKPKLEGKRLLFIGVAMLCTVSRQTHSCLGDSVEIHSAKLKKCTLHCMYQGGIIFFHF